MRLANVSTPDGLRLHVRAAGGGHVDVAAATGDPRLAELRAVLDGGDAALALVRRAAEGDGRAVADAELGPAVPSPNRILCLGVNYLEHALEGGRPPTRWPEVFVRGADCVAAPFGELVRPELVGCFDYEGELGVVIGRAGRYVRARDAASLIAGYVVVNDATAREWQRPEGATQWTPGKNFDGTMPIGPELVTADEVDVADVQLVTRLNGEVMQSARTSAMIFDIPRTIEFLSSFTTLRPGDVIATGTPAGVGFARRPPVWLAPGDLIEVEIEGVGRIANRVVGEEAELGEWPWIPPVPEALTL